VGFEVKVTASELRPTTSFLIRDEHFGSAIAAFVA
jgi:hypothetical protein